MTAPAERGGRAGADRCVISGGDAHHVASGRPDRKSVTGAHVSSAVIEEWREMRRNSLLGFARVRLPSGMILHDVAVHRTGDRHWASPPARPMVGKNDLVVRDNDGKVKYSPCIEFAGREIRDRWSGLVIEALRVAHPKALA